MKSRRRYSSSESEESAASVESASDSEESSESEASDSVTSERARREKKHKRRAPSSGSASEAETRRRPKKRKHKKKKKKHSKKRRRDSTHSEPELSESQARAIMVEERVQQLRALRRKNSHMSNESRSRSPSVQQVPLMRTERKPESSRGGARLQSVVKERRRSPSSIRISPPSPEPHRYYDGPKQREKSASEEEYGGRRREEEVERFYRGSSKDRSQRSGQPRYHETRYDEHHRYGGGGYGNGGGHEQFSRTQRPRDHGDCHSRQERRGAEEFPREEHYRSHREREYVPRHETFHQHGDRGERPPRPYIDNRRGGPTCLVCDETHPGRECRRRALPDRFRPSERERLAPDRDHRPPPDKHVVVKREREERQPARGAREERVRSSRERRERSAPITPRRETARASPGPASREQRARSPRRVAPPAAALDKRERKESPPGRRDRKSRFNEAEGKNFSWGKTEVKAEAAPADKAKPDFALSGKLAADTNTVNGIVLKYSEPSDAKQPKRRWRFYPFKGDKALPILYIHRQSCFILGREHKAVDIPLEHPSVSKQHAALQYRATPYTRPDGTQARRVRPYIIDLDSANGTFVNNKKIETRCFVELLERDVVKFGFSQREYVLLHENSKDDGDDDNQEMGSATGTAVAGEVTSIATVKREKQVKQELKEDGE